MVSLCLNAKILKRWPASNILFRNPSLQNEHYYKTIWTQDYLWTIYGSSLWFAKKVFIENPWLITILKPWVKYRKQSKQNVFFFAKACNLTVFQILHIQAYACMVLPMMQIKLVCLITSSCLNKPKGTLNQSTCVTIKLTGIPTALHWGHKWLIGTMMTQETYYSLILIFC